MNKRITALLVVLTMIFTVMPLNAYAADLIQEEPISKGLTLTNIKRTTSAGKLNINVVKADLNEPSLTLKVLANQSGLDNSATVKNLANQHGAAVAVNTDFFTWINDGVLAEGMTISGGEVLTSPSNDSIYATVAQKEDGSVFLDYFTYTMTLTSKRTRQSERIYYYNKNGQDMYIKLFDRSYGEYAPDSTNDSIELVVEDGVVTEMLSNKPAPKIPENGYIIKHSLRHSLFLTENFQVGDEVDISFEITPDIEGITEATGGGSIILKNGKKAQYTHTVSGRQPRTAIGIDESGKILYLVTVDGRQNSSVGMTMDELTAFMQEIGAYNAINCDGGGSTQMAAKLMGEETATVNSPSDNRAVAVGLGIIAERKKGTYSHLRVTMPSERIASGSPVDVWARGYDEYGNEVDLSEFELTYESNKQGVFEGNIYYPYEVGTHTVTVTAGGISGIRHLEVYEENLINDMFKESVNGEKNYGVFGSNTTSLTMFTNLAARMRNNAANKLDLSVFRTIPEEVTAKTFTASGFAMLEEKNALFVSVDNKNLTLINNQQFKNAVLSTDKNNIFVVLPKEADSNELFELKHFLRSKAYGKRVFFISYGAENEARAESGIYFISVSDIPAFDKNNFESVLDKSKYLKIAMNGDSVKCSFESYFN